MWHEDSVSVATYSVTETHHKVGGGGGGGGGGVGNNHGNMQKCATDIISSKHEC